MHCFIGHELTAQNKILSYDSKKFYDDWHKSLQHRTETDIMKRALSLRLLSSAALAATLVVNALANILPINGLTTGEVADRYSSLFTPAGFTF